MTSWPMRCPTSGSLDTPLRRQRIGPHPNARDDQAGGCQDRGRPDRQASTVLMSAEQTIRDDAPSGIRQAAAGVSGDRTLPELTGNHFAAGWDVANR